MKTKKSNIKRKRRFIAFLVFLFLIVILLFFFFQKKDYSVNYKVNDFVVTETYNKQKNYYSFLIKKDENEFFTIVNDQHFTSKKIIYDIESFDHDQENCIKISSGKARFSTLCIRNNEQVSIHLVSSDLKEKMNLENNSFSQDVISTYHKINIYNYLNASYYIWNYRGFYRMNNSKQKEISLFSKDIYSPSLMTQVGNYLFIPDYEADYFFKKVYILNMINGKVDTWNLPNNIYFDSSILGVYENELYLVDKHEKVEWKINLEKRKMERVGTESKGGTIYNYEWQDVSMNKLIYQENSFKGVQIYDFEIKDDALYAVVDNHSIKVRDKAPNKIISSHDGYVYYLVENRLYGYSDNTGEVLLLDYFEWNFNSDNVIFILN